MTIDTGLTTRSLFVRSAALSMVAVAVFAAFLVAKSGTPLATTVADIVLQFAAAAAAVSCFRAARRRDADARGWAVLGVAALTWGAGNAIWTVYGLTRDHVYPFPSVADLGFVGFGPIAAVALLCFPRAGTLRVSPVRAGLDALLIAASVLFISWALVLGNVYHTTAASLLSQATAMAYPIADVAVGSLVLALGMRRPAGSRLPWLLLGGGLVTLALTDSTYVYRNLAGTFSSGTVLYAGWLVAFLLIALAPMAPARDAVAGERTRSLFQESLPYLPFVTALVVAGAGQRVDLNDPFLFWNGLIVLLVFLARQALIVAENVALTSDLQTKVERRTAEFHSADERFRSLVQSSDDAIVSKTVDGVITTWNPGAERLYGYREAEVIGRPVTLLVPPERLEEEAAILAAAGRGVQLARYETERVRKDGSIVPVALTVSPILDGDKVQGVSVIGHDISERRRNDEALRGQQEHTRAIIDTASDPFVAMDEQGVVTDWNCAAERTFGWSREEAVGRLLAETIVPPRHRDAHAEGIRRVEAGGEPHVIGTRVEIEAQHREGSELQVELSIWRAGQGAGGGFNAFLHDITDRKQGEQDLATARNQALEASRLKSEFLATMSHEIRTPLNGVIGLTGLLLDSELSEAQRRHAEGVRASGEALLGIINDVLDFSKIEAGKLEIETVDFDLTHALEDVASLVTESARAKGLELVAYCRPEVPTVLRGDVGRLRQILLNLATNAVKFTEHGEVVLRAGLDEQSGTDQVVVRFEVSDTGIGIKPEAAERLFDPFSQADASTTRRYGGTGLGLAICRRLAEAMGGSIGLDARAGEGTTFWVRLPFQHALLPVPTAGEARTHSLEGKRILVVDDNETNRLVLASQLRAWDITADLAADAEVALRLLRAAAGAHPYDLAVVDMAMPGMDGLELAGIVSTDHQLAGIPLLLLSSVTVEFEAATRAGFAARLTKPVHLSQLYDALVRALTPHAGGLTASAPTPAAARGARGKLLIVEDHAINQEVAKGIVAKLGYSCDVAGDGIEALAALDRQGYDAVLMDCHMPHMDGFQATAEIRRLEAGRRHLPIIAMTAGAMVEDREKCLAAGMDDYLTKPVKERALEDMLNLWLDDAGPEGAGNGAGRAEPETGGVLDLEQFDQLRQLALTSGDPDLLGRFVDQYLAEATSRLAELHAAAQNGDAKALEEAAHGLKGTSATIGAVAVAAACAPLELAARHGQQASVVELEQVSSALERAATALQAQVRDAALSAGLLPGPQLT